MKIIAKKINYCFNYNCWEVVLNINIMFKQDFVLDIYCIFEILKVLDFVSYGQDLPHLIDKYVKY